MGLEGTRDFWEARVLGHQAWSSVAGLFTFHCAPEGRSNCRQRWPGPHLPHFLAEGLWGVRILGYALPDKLP